LCIDVYIEGLKVIRYHSVVADDDHGIAEFLYGEMRQGMLEKDARRLSLFKD
jgi:hypothetical protein